MGGGGIGRREPIAVPFQELGLRASPQRLGIHEHTVHVEDGRPEGAGQHE
jgi:hypothetical protein